MQNFKIFSKQLKEKVFFTICHLNTRSLSEKYLQIKRVLNGNFSAVVVAETWRDETANKNSLVEIPNNSALHLKQEKIEKEVVVYAYMFTSLKFNVRDDIDIFFNECVETLPIEILNKKSGNVLITATYRPPKGNNKRFKDFCKDFLNKQVMSNKAAFVLGEFNWNIVQFTLHLLHILCVGNTLMEVSSIKIYSTYLGPSLIN